MVGVQKHHQESGNSASATYIHGHLFGVLGVVTGSEKKYFCTLISASIHSGVEIVRRWSGETEETGSHVEQLVRDALSVAKTMGSSFLVLDRYFLSSPALALLQEARATSDQSVLTLVTKAKSNVVAYTKPGSYSGRGRPSKKGETLHLSTLFETRAAQFQSAKVVLYGKSETVRYLGLDLLWGKSLYQELRFVLVERRDGSRAILVCSDTAVDPLQVIRLYSLRFKIEVTFRALKQDLAGFFYHFWSKSMPKLKRFTKKGAADPLESVVDPQKQQSICRNLKAIEGYVALQCIAQGLLQLFALRYTQTSVFTRLRYLRTYSSTVLSEASVMDILRRDIFRSLTFHPDLSIMRIIRSKQLNYPEPSDVHVA